MAKKILFINQEIVPYVPDSNLSLMGKALPQAMQDAGHEIRTFMPKWGIINERRGQLHEVIRLSGMNLIIDDTDHPLIIKVATIVGTRIQVYFIDNEDYFTKRKMEQDENGKDYADNGERAIFFARGVLESQEAALGTRHHPCTRMDECRSSPLHQDGLPRGALIRQYEGGDITLPQDHHL